LEQIDKGWRQNQAVKSLLKQRLYETVARETPANRATSACVGRLFIWLLN
jgi:hypothetical protein